MGSVKTQALTLPLRFFNVENSGFWNTDGAS
jgi:hypothetical protein